MHTHKDTHTHTGTSQHKVWRVRPYAPSDFAALVQLQTDSFHTPLPLPVLDKLAKMSLRAEVGGPVLGKLAKMSLRAALGTNC
eukprot:705856-Pelagomonas_calceolata.AAC.2